MIAGSYGKTMFTFVRNCQTFFQRFCTIFLFQQQWMKVPVAPHSVFSVISVLDFRHSKSCVVVSYVLIWNSSETFKMLSYFSYAYLPSVYLLRWGVCLDLLTTF